MEGSVVFVATQSDVLQPHEIRRALKLRADASVQECAAARNKFTSQRVASDFLDGLVEMATAAGDTVDRDEYERKFKLPVFTVSSMDYQKVRERVASGSLMIIFIAAFRAKFRTLVQARILLPPEVL